MSQRRKRKKYIDYTNMDDILDRAMDKLDVEMSSIDDKLDSAMSDMDKKIERTMAAVNRVTAHGPYVPLKTKSKSTKSSGGSSISVGSRTPKEHSFSFRSNDGNHITVKYNSNTDYSIQTDGDLNFTSSFTKDIRRRIIEDAAGSIIPEESGNDLPAHVQKACQQIERMRAGKPVTSQTQSKHRQSRKNKVSITDRYFMEDPGPVENIWSEDMFGNLKRPLSDDLRMDTKVRVSSRPGLSCVLLSKHPKYQVFADGVEVYMCEMEGTMRLTKAETWLGNWSDEELHFLQEALKGIVALHLNSKYHDETLSVLDKRLSKQRDGDGDVGDSVGTDGGS
jgi:hypothetical protein